MNFFDISNIFITLLGYQLSYLEFMAVLTGFVAVYLASLGKVENFYVGLINNLLYFFLFYQCHLYSMMLLQAIYFAISTYGIYAWQRPASNAEQLKITALTHSGRWLIAAAVVAVAIFWGLLVVRPFGGFSAICRNTRLSVCRCVADNSERCRTNTADTQKNRQLGSLDTCQHRQCCALCGGGHLFYRHSLCAVFSHRREGIFPMAKRNE